VDFKEGFWEVQISGAKRIVWVAKITIIASMWWMSKILSKE
jgi:hypothetical protein